MGNIANRAGIRGHIKGRKNWPKGLLHSKNLFFPESTSLQLVAFASLNSVLVGLFVFFTSRKSGFWADDFGFLKTFMTTGINDWWEQSLTYVPGRNLHVIWQNIFFFISGESGDFFERYHLVQSLIVGLNAGLVAALLLRLRLAPLHASLFAVFGALWPGSLEAVHWPSALPMHIFSLTLLLWQIHLLLSMSRKGVSFRRVALFAPVHLSAVFTYEQGAFPSFLLLGILLAISISARNRDDQTRQVGPKPTVIGSIFVVLVLDLIYLFLLVFQRASTSGPAIEGGEFGRLFTSALRWAGNMGLPHQIEGVERSLSLMVVFILLLTVFSALGIATTRGIWRVPQRRIRGVVRLTKSALILPLFGFSLAVFSYLPIWIWYESPRHRYIPIILTVTALALLWKRALDYLPGLVAKRVEVLSAIFLALGVTLAVSSNVQYGMHRAEIFAEKTSVYNGIYAFFGPVLDDRCLSFHDISPLEAGMFYSERIDYAYVAINQLPFPSSGCQSSPNFEKAHSLCDGSIMIARDTFSLGIRYLDDTNLLEQLEEMHRCFNSTR